MALRSPLPLPAPIRKLLAPRDPMIAYQDALRAADGPNAARDWPEAEARNAEVLRLNPLRAEAWIAYGDALRGLGRDGEALAAFRAAADLEPENAIALERLGAPLTAPDAPFRDVDDLPTRVPPDFVAPRSERPALVFLHLQKTGGMTLHHTLERYFAPARICPIRDDHMHLCTAAELAGYDVFSGHFDIGALRLVGRRPLRTMSLFREPRARLISFYRFHVGHALAGKYLTNPFVRLAHAMSAEEFFEDPRVRREPEVFNHYLAAFGLTYHQLRAAQRVDVGRIDETTVARAIDRVRRLDMIGLQERLPESLALIFATLVFRPPRRIVTRNATDRVATEMRRAVPPPVAMTPRLEAALEELTRFDRAIYAAAKEEFERRLAVVT